jgi:hypothetical protein
MLKYQIFISIKAIILFFLIGSCTNFDYLPYGPEFIPSKSGNSDSTPIVARLSTDFYAISFSGTIDAKNRNVYFSIYDSTGKLVKDTTQVNVDYGYNTYNWIAADNTGGFAIIWNKKDAPGFCCNVNEVWARYYDKNFTAGKLVKLNPKPPSANTDQMYPTVAFTGTYFFGCFNPDYDSAYSYTIYSQQMSLPDLSFLGSIRRIGNVVPGHVQYGCVAKDLGNGSFVISYHTTEFGDFDMVFEIVTEKDFLPIKPMTRINTHLPGQQADPSITVLNTTPVSFVITWWDWAAASKGDVIIQIYDYKGNPIGTNITVNQVGYCSYPVVSSLGVDGFVVMYKCNPGGGIYNIYYQLMNNTGAKIGVERKVNTTTDNVSVRPYVDSKFGNIMMLYSSTKLNYAQIFVRDSGKCSDFVHYYNSHSTSVNIVFQGIDDDSKYVNIAVLPKAIGASMKTISGPAVITGNLYERGELIYTLTNAGTDEFYFNTNQVDKVCKVTLTPCAASCSDCDGIGDSTNQHCTKCADGFYPLSNNTSNCYKATDTVPGYYFETDVFKQCFKSCQTCTSYPLAADKDMLCKSCIANFYSKEDKPTSCFTGVQSGYYFNGLTYKKCFNTCQACTATPFTTDNNQCTACIETYYPKTDNKSSCFNGSQVKYYFDKATSMYQKCWSTCNTCLGQGSDSDNQCDTCIDKYFHKVDQMTNCFTGSLDKYYFDGKIYQKCYPSCQTCTTTPPTDTIHQCTKCLDGYYPTSDDKSTCFTGDVDGYFFSNGLYSKCYPSCKLCKVTGDPKDHKCDECGKGYSKKEGSNNCETTGKPIPGYYFDKANNIYKKCYKSCETCSADGTKDNHNCTKCAQDYFARADNDKLCYSPKDNDLPNWFFDEDSKVFKQCYQACKTCSKSGTADAPNCDKCADGYSPTSEDKTMCHKNSDPLSGYFYDTKTSAFEKCFETCTECTDQGDEHNHQCKSCKDGFVSKEDDPTSCFKADKDMIGYYLDKKDNMFKQCYNDCAECTGPGNIKTPNCTKCKDDSKPCNGCADYTYRKNACLKKCPLKTIVDEVKRECIDCKDGQVVLDNACLDKCPDGYIKNSDSCMTCLSINKKFYGDSCVDDCPQYYVSDSKNLCVPLDISLDLESN